MSLDEAGDRKGVAQSGAKQLWVTPTIRRIVAGSAESRRPSGFVDGGKKNNREAS